LMFALFGGLSNESGISATLYTFGLVFAVNLVAHLTVIALYKRRISPASAWVSLSEHRRLIAS